MAKKKAGAKKPAAKKKGSSPDEGAGEVSPREVRMKRNPAITKRKKSDPVPVDKVKIQVTTRIECAIGKKFYTFVVGKDYLVSAVVHRILVDRGVVKPTY